MVRFRRISNDIKSPGLRNIRKGCRASPIQFRTGNRVTPKRVDAGLTKRIAGPSFARMGPGRYSTASPLSVHTGVRQSVFQTVLQYNKDLTGKEICHAWTSGNCERNASGRYGSWR